MLRWLAHRVRRDDTAALAQLAGGRGSAGSWPARDLHVASTNPIVVEANVVLTREDIPIYLFFALASLAWLIG
ncbi:MAG TPA: hypothetical protein RMH99_08885 [Sandaracinaceae bacterium LLY-WYZ-13_1]|nr:hypothetical protein [Sandaracinaceae bacterium LLY-WYZ-13_1]